MCSGRGASALLTLLGLRSRHSLAWATLLTTCKLRDVVILRNSYFDFFSLYSDADLSVVCVINC